MRVYGGTSTHTTWHIKPRNCPRALFQERLHRRAFFVTARTQVPISRLTGQLDLGGFHFFDYGVYQT